MEYRSEDLKELFTALSKAQAEMHTAGLSNTNPFFKSKYADLAEIVKSSRPALTKNGLTVIQQILPNEHGKNVLHTVLGHTSGQWIESRMELRPAKDDIQGLGSCISYCRRYSYAALVGVIVSDEDDDGETAVDRNPKPSIKQPPVEYISMDQIQMLVHELDGHPDVVSALYKSGKVNSFSEIRRENFQAALEFARRNVAVKNNQGK